MRGSPFATAVYASVAAAALLTGCHDGGIAGVRPTVPVTLTFCDYTRFVAVQNEGGQWTTADSLGSSAVMIDATERIAIATFTDDPIGTVSVYFLTRDQAKKRFSCAVPGKQWTGTVISPGADQSIVWVASSGAEVLGSGSAFTIPNVPDGPLDVVATDGLAWIVRHDQNYPDGSALPVLDFGAEGFALDSGDAVPIQADSGGFYAFTDLFTANGTRAYLGKSRADPCCHDVLFPSVPVAQLAPGDLNHVRVEYDPNYVDFFEDEEFFTTWSPHPVQFGPPVTHPTVTDDSGKAGVLWRVDEPVQPEYSRVFLAIVGGNTAVNVYETSEYRGSASTWSVTVPDLAALPGFHGIQVAHPSNAVSVKVSAVPWAYDAPLKAGDRFLAAFYIAP